PLGRAGRGDDDISAGVAALPGGPDPDEPRLAVGERPQRLADDDRLGACAADPSDEAAVGPHDGPVAAPRRRRPADADHRGEHVRLARGRQPPRLDDDLVRPHSASPAWFSASHTRDGVTGISMLRTPACASASTTAFTYAAGDPTVADSPTPLAPNGWCGDGVTVLCSSNSGVSHAVGSM